MKFQIVRVTRSPAPAPTISADSGKQCIWSRDWPISNIPRKAGKRRKAAISTGFWRGTQAGSLLVRRTEPGMAVVRGGGRVPKSRTGSLVLSFFPLESHFIPFHLHCHFGPSHLSLLTTFCCSYSHLFFLSGGSQLVWCCQGREAARWALCLRSDQLLVAGPNSNSSAHRLLQLCRALGLPRTSQA